MKTSVKNITPLGSPWRASDPFLFCAYHNDKYPAGNGKLGIDPDKLTNRNIGQDFQIKDGFRMYHGSAVPGFPYHPHRGFETITVVKQGIIDHSDSLGAAGRYSAGDVQWMTAGKGVQHSEMFPLVNEDKGNSLELFQIWLNLPKQSKMVDADFKMLWKEDIPVVIYSDDEERKTTIDLIAGELSGKRSLDPTPDSWASDPENEVSVMTIVMEPEAIWTLPAASEGVNRTLYFYEGNNIEIEGQKISSGNSIVLEGENEVEIKNGGERTKLLLLQGKPINEPVVQYGPFVMNTEQEIQQAFADYRRTQFGGWPWPETEQVHGKTAERFALHADGRKEERSFHHQK